MSKVIIISPTYPAYHHLAGQPTYFVEKLFVSLNNPENVFNCPLHLNIHMLNEAAPKHHTIRRGHRWKVGDKFSPRVWSDKPYRSPQITIAPDIEIVKIWDFTMDLCGVFAINGKYVDPDDYERLAENDGLTEADMFKWFMPNYDNPVEFDGQILCWNDKIEY